MGGLIDKVVADIRRGTPASVYLLHGDELVAREGARAIVDALVPADRQALSVETISEDAEAATVPGRLRTVPLFGGIKVVVVHDTKAFTSKQNVGELFRKSWEAWKVRDGEKAERGLLQAVAVAGQDRSFLERAAQGELPAVLWKELLTVPPTNESEQWLRETASRLVAEGSEIPEAAGAATAAVFEDLLKQGVPSGAVLILTAEVVDQRRALFKRIAEAGVVVDCGVRAGKLGETQMKPEVARARIAEAVHHAGKRIDEGATTCIVDRTGFSVRTLESELEKILLYVGNRAEVRLADVLAVLSSSREASIFDLTNAVESRDVAGALHALRALAGQREAAPAMLGMIAATIRSLHSGPLCTGRPAGRAVRFPHGLRRLPVACGSAPGGRRRAGRRIGGEAPRDASVPGLQPAQGGQPLHPGGTPARPRRDPPGGPGAQDHRPGGGGDPGNAGADPVRRRHRERLRLFP